MFSIKKLSELGEIPEDVILCTVDVVGLHPNIPHEEGLEALRRALDGRENKSVSTEFLTELAQVVLLSNRIISGFIALLVGLRSKTKGTSHSIFAC